MPKNSQSATLPALFARYKKQTSEKFLKKTKEKLFAFSDDEVFRYASKQVELKNCTKFLQVYCEKDTADARCLCLYAYCLEMEEAGCKQNWPLIEVLVNRAVKNAQKIHNSTIVVQALMHLARLQLDYIDFQAPNATECTKEHAAKRAEKTMSQCFEFWLEIPLNKNVEDEYCLLNARIADRLDNSKLALRLYRKLLQNSPKDGFLLARICVLSQKNSVFVHENIESAIEWLDDQGVGSSDSEMPELVCRYAVWALDQDFSVEKLAKILLRGSDCNDAESSFQLYRLLSHTLKKLEQFDEPMVYLKKSLEQNCSDKQRAVYQTDFAKKLYVQCLNGLKKNENMDYIQLVVEIDKQLCEAMKNNPRSIETLAMAAVFYNYNKVRTLDDENNFKKPASIVSQLKPIDIVAISRVWQNHSELLSFQLLCVCNGWRPGSNLIENELQRLVIAKKRQRKESLENHQASKRAKVDQ